MNTDHTCGPQAAAGGLSRYDTLDGMRGVAAIVVMVYHFIQTDAPLRLGGVELIPLENAQLAVDFFFVLSGFVIAHSYGGRLLQGMPPGEYLAKRLIRLYPMFLLGLAVGTAGLLLLATTGQSGYRNRDIVGSLAYNALFLPFFGALRVKLDGAFLSVSGALFPANPPAWSLLFEMVASAGFLALVRFGPRTLLKIALASYAALVANGLLLAFRAGELAFDCSQGWGLASFMGGFPRVLFGFTAGMLVQRAASGGLWTQRRLVWPSRLGPSAVYLVLVLLLAAPLKLGGLYPMLVLLLAAPALVLVGAATPCAPGRQTRVARVLGWLSYPVYCLHYPVGRLVYLASPDPQPGRLWLAAASLAATVAAAVVLTKAVEEPARRLLARAVASRARRPRTDLREREEMTTAPEIDPRGRTE